MKKIFIIFLAICIAICCIGCSQEDQNDEISDVQFETSENQSTEITISDINISDEYSNDYIFENGPPRNVEFDGFSQMAELKSMANADDEEAQTYLESNNYCMNGLPSKDYIPWFFDEIGNLNLIHINEASGYIAHIDYCFDYKTIDTIYVKGTDKVRIISYLDVNKTPPNREGRQIVETISVSGYEIVFYDISDVNFNYPIIGTLCTSDSYIMVQFSSLEAMKSKEFMTLGTVDSFVSVATLPSTDEKEDEDLDDFTKNSIFFGSFHRMKELAIAAYGDYEEFQDYLSNNSFGKTADEIIDVFDRISDLNILCIDEASGYKNIELYYYMNNDIMYSTYIKGDDEILIMCCLETYDAPKPENKDYKYILSVGEYEIGITDISNENSGTVFRGMLYTSDAKIMIQFTNAEVAELGDYMKLDTVNNLIFYDE